MMLGGEKNELDVQLEQERSMVTELISELHRRIENCDNKEVQRQLYVQLAMVKSKSGKKHEREEGRRSLMKFVDSGYAHPEELYYSMALSFYGTGDWSQSRIYVEKLLRMEPEHPAGLVLHDLCRSRQEKGERYAVLGAVGATAVAVGLSLLFSRGRR